MTQALTPEQQDQIFDLVRSYRDDPIGFMTTFLDVEPEHVWDKMREVCGSVVLNQRTVVKAGHSVSKTYTAARLVLWFLYTRAPHATVITTAPGAAQVEGVLWREIRDCFNNSRYDLGGELTATKLDIGAKWFALGFSTRPDTVTQQATRVQGYHNEHVMIIFDEAAGIMPQIWQAAETLLIEPQHRFLGIGNPTSPVGEFPSCFNNELYHGITISVKDTPNFKEGRQVIPGLAGREFEKRYRDKYGADSPIYQSRVLGEIPDHGEGIVYSREMARIRVEGRIRDVPHDPVHRVYTAWDIGSKLGGPTNAICFFQLIGSELLFFDFISDINRGLDYFCQEITSRNYTYGGHFGGPDLMQASSQTGMTTVQFSRNLGVPLRPVRPHRVDEGIQTVRSVLNRCIFDRNKCRILIEALCQYHRLKDERLSTADNPTYQANPVHDWASHPADAIRHAAMAYRQGMVRGYVEDVEDEPSGLVESYMVRTSL